MYLVGYITSPFRKLGRSQVSWRQSHDISSPYLTDIFWVSIPIYLSLCTAIRPRGQSTLYLVTNKKPNTLCILAHFIGSNSVNRELSMYMCERKSKTGVNNFED